MALEARLMAVEVIYLWRALPFCSEATKTELLGTLSAALPPDSQPVHQAMTAWLKGGVLNSLGRVADAEKVQCVCACVCMYVCVCVCVCACVHL